MAASVALEDPLHDDLAPLVLEVDVDVGRFASLFGDEALKEEVVAAGIDRGDAEHVADGGVRRRAAALAEDVLRSREADDRAHGQEVRRIFQLCDQAQFMLQRRAHAVRHALGISLLGALPGQPLQHLLRRDGRVVPLLRILVAQLIEREAAAVGDLDRAGERITREEPLHLLDRLQIAISVALASVAELVDGDVVPDAGHNVLKHATGGLVEEHVVRHHRRHTDRLRHLRQLIEPELIVRAAAQCQREIGAVWEGIAQASKVYRREIVRLIRHEHGDESFRVGHDIVPVEDALGLAAPLLADRQQPAQPGIGSAVRRVDQDRHAVGEVEPAADDQSNPCRLRCLMRPDDAGQRIPVDDAQRFDPARFRLGEQFLRRRCSAKEAEVRGDLKLGIAQRGHLRNSRTMFLLCSIAIVHTQPLGGVGGIWVANGLAGLGRMCVESCPIRRQMSSGQTQAQPSR
jgi:hypothetical protein